MRLRNKKTGEIIDVDFIYPETAEFFYPNFKLVDFNELFEDYEEPKGKALYWMILTLENFIENEPDDKWVDLEDCKQMLEKLKALQRLKDNGMIKYSFHKEKRGIDLDFYTLTILAPRDEDSLDLLFGGEE